MIERKLNCLRALGDYSSPMEVYIPFGPIVRETGLTRNEVRCHVRALARAGLAHFAKGLWTPDGEPAGAGYCITLAGIKYL